MSSVSINRYWGEENDSKQSTHDNSLQNLLSKIEERRKKQKHKIYVEKQSSSIQDTINQNALEEPLIKKSKTDVDCKDPTDPVLNVASTSDSFTIISNIEFKKYKKLKRILPNWLQNPFVIPVDLKHLSVTVRDIAALDSTLVETLEKNKITHFFPVQSELIPWLLNYHRKYSRYWPRDVCVSAPTGSGKTLAFVLPIIQLIKQRLVRYVRALVVLPTKDLAFQVFKVFKQYIIYTDLKAICLGNLALEKEKIKLVDYGKISGSRSQIDIVVTTPGRLIEHLKYTDGFSLENLEFLVIDEADHVMDSTQNDWLRHLQSHIPPFCKNSEIPFLTLSNVTTKPYRPQKLLFSATLSQDPEKLRHLNLFQPCLFTSVVKSNEDENSGVENNRTFVGKYATPSELIEYYTICPLSTKPLVLYYIIKQNDWQHILCFADSASNVHKLSSLLRFMNSLDDETNEWVVEQISSQLSNDQHHEILHKFATGSINILVTTDNLARGIDLQNVKYVVLYDTPKFVKNYIHRIGRTARAGQEGTSLVLVTPEEKNGFENILKTCSKDNVRNMKVDVSELKKLESVYKMALENLKSSSLNKTERMENSSTAQKKKKARKRKNKTKHF